jgi:hypothetical protein
MSMTEVGLLGEGFKRGPLQGQNIIGETTEAFHRFLLDGWQFDRPPPRIEEDLSFVPKDREEVLYIYMYRMEQNQALKNSKAFRPAKVTLMGADRGLVYYERPPIYLNLYYMVAFHSKFRSDAERLMGWVLLRLYEATHLVYRPRRYLLPDGRVVDSTGAAWDAQQVKEDTIMEKVALALVDDLTVGDAINFYTIHEAPYRPYLTYRAQCAMEGALVSGPPTTVRGPSEAEVMGDEPNPRDRANGRMVGAAERAPARPRIGPPGHDYRSVRGDNQSED